MRLYIGGATYNVAPQSAGVLCGVELKDILQYNKKNHTWEAVGMMKWGRCRHAVTVLQDGPCKGKIAAILDLTVRTARGHTDISLYEQPGDIWTSLCTNVTA